MADRNQLPHILALLDDGSETVQASVKAALISFGAGLDAALDEVGASGEQRQAVAELLRESGADPLFQVGQLVRHKRYGYRGVVVARDDQCRASEDWYERNKTQPERDQPWYHVLADGSDQAFYPAETSLEADDSEEAVQNPYVTEFFLDFQNGVYVRNDRPWSE